MSDPDATPPPAPAAPPAAPPAGRLIAAGFWGLAAFALLGLALEAVHAFKLGPVLDAGNEGRRLLLRLGHAHGTLLSLVALMSGLWLRGAPTVPEGAARRVTACLLGALALLPGGFLLGALGATGADPGPGVLLTPAGALLLVAGLVTAARAAAA